MKIKFLRPFRLYNPIGDAFIRDEGTVEDMGKEDYAQWLVDNGFAEEVKELGWWKPKLKEEYYLLSNVGEIIDEPWLGSRADEFRYSTGNCFKTEKAANRWRDYLKAVETVRHDEGFMEPAAEYHHGHGIGINCYGEPYAEQMYTDHYAGRFYFDSSEHAKASVVAHQSEWKTILDYDWSKE